MNLISLRPRYVWLALAVCFALSIVSIGGQAGVVTFIAGGSAWRYNDTGTDLGTAWRASGYSDSSWSIGAAQLGFGDADEATIVSYGPDPNNKFITTYFRHSFTVANPGNLASLLVQVKRDDGCVIYLNGSEVARSNMPGGQILYGTMASTAINESFENSWHEFPIDPSLLVAGTNVVAVEVHQNAPSSTDLSFDLVLKGTPIAQAPPIVVQLTSPADGAVVNSTSVTFQAAVSATAGLASASLQLGGSSQTVMFSGTAQVQDAQLTADSPTLANGSAPSLKVDGAGPHAHSVMKFPTLVGSGAGQVPAGSSIVSATLRVTCTNLGHMMRLFRLTQDWVENQATWNERSAGVPWGSAGADGPASNAGVERAGDCTAVGQRTIDLTTFVQEWVSGQPNYGIVFADSGSDGVDFDSSEGASGPLLTVVYQQQLLPSQSVALSGTSANVSIPVVLPAGSTFTWNIEVTDLGGVKQRAPSDFQFTVDLAMPDDPIAIAPLPGATNVDPAVALVSRVGTPAGGTVTATVAVRPASAPEFSVVVLPDTQHYSESFPSVFTSQTQWIVANKASRNIVFVTHEGDVVEHADLVPEWDRANASMSLLDGVVPYGLGPGNHDIPTTLFNQYFPFTRYQGLPWYGGHYQNLNDNNFQLFSGGGKDFIIAHLQFCPPAGAVAWAKSVFDANPTRIGLMTTHGYLDTAAQRSVHICGSTQYLWDNLGAITPNLHFMLSGHVHGESRRSDVANGHPVYQMLADYQDRTNGGDGWLRILRFVPAEDRIYVQTYSPWLNQFERDADSEFTLDFPMSAPFVTSAPMPVPSGSNATFQPPSLQPMTAYEWRVTVTNAAGKTRVGPLWKFTTGAGGPGNQPPYANSATVHLDEDSSMGVTVQAGDPEGQPLTYTLVSGPANGTLSGTLPAVTYQPAQNFTGTDTFTFRVSDGQLTSAVATITLVVDPVNDPPAAAPDSYAVTAATTLTVTAPGVLANDTDIEGGPLTAVLDATVSHGTLTLNANGSFSYTPTSGYSGPDAFSYRASDGSAVSAPAVVSITVTPAANQPPVATSSTVNVTEDVAKALTVSAADPEGQPLTYILVGGPANGTLSGTLPAVTYQPASNFSGTDSFTFRVSDGQLTSNTATVTLVVDPVNDAPVATADAYSVNAGSSLTVNAPGVLANDTDVEASPLTAQLVAGVAHGALALNANGSFTYTPTAGYSGPDSFSYRASDGAAVSGAVAVSITVNAVNQPPVANPSSVSAVEDTAIGITVSGTDPEGQALTYALVTAPSHGVLSGTLPAVTYQPAANYSGPDAFTFRVSDGQLNSSPATVTINVAAVNDPPVAAGDSYSVNTGTSLVVNAPGVLANDADVDNASISAQLVSSTSNGTLTLNPNGSFTYTPAAAFVGLDSFSYRATDGAASSLAVAVNIVVMGLPPGPLFTANFSTGTDGFTYEDDTFRGTNQPAYALGTWQSSGGFNGGAIRVQIGNVNGTVINNMSGGYRRSFTLTAPASLTLTFRYRMDTGHDYESTDFSQVLASLDGVLLRTTPSVDYIRQVFGDGNNGPPMDTGWQLVTISLGTVPAGTHSLVLGGFNNQKNTESERTRIWFDDVSVIVK